MSVDRIKPKQNKGVASSMSIPMIEIPQGKAAHPEIARTVRFNNPEVAKLYNQYYLRFVSSYLNMQGWLNRAKKWEAFPKHVEKYVNQLLKITNKALKSEIESTREITKDLDSFDAVTFPKASEVTGVPIHAPAMSKYLDVMSNVDALVSLNYYMYITEQIDGETMTSDNRTMLKVIKGTCNRIQSVSREIERLSKKSEKEIEDAVGKLTSNLLRHQKKILDIR